MYFFRVLISSVETTTVFEKNALVRKNETSTLNPVISTSTQKYLPKIAACLSAFALLVCDAIETDDDGLRCNIQQEAHC